MGFWSNSFVRFCTSGMGTGTNAGKALGYAILVVAFLFILAYYLIKWSWKMIQYFRNRNAEKNAAEEATGEAKE